MIVAILMLYVGFKINAPLIYFIALGFSLGVYCYRIEKTVTDFINFVKFKSMVEGNINIEKSKEESHE